MNFNGTFDSVSTIIHELGHSLNSYYYNKYNYHYSSTTIFTAEIPSIVNETLLGEHMIKTNKNPVMVANFLMEIIGNFFNTTTRQIVFSNFEFLANDLVNNSKPFTKETLKKIYLEMNDKYVGIKDFKRSYSEPYCYSLATILRIPHFYAGNFYVYKYAIGQIVAINVVRKILKKEPGFLEKYFNFLKSGTAKTPLETIKILGIDLEKPEPYKIAIDYIIEKVEQLKKIAKVTKFN
jgi:oligoendopeptidase F